MTGLGDGRVQASGSWHASSEHVVYRCTQERLLQVTSHAETTFHTDVIESFNDKPMVSQHVLKEVPVGWPGLAVASSQYIEQCLCILVMPFSAQRG